MRYALFAMILLWAGASASELDFSLHRLGDGGQGRTLLVIGGIQGDEPGGFNAASLLVTDYRITSGRVWVVPNLNFLSIVKRSRGVHGDLNRKFAHLPAHDPEFHTVERIKGIIRDPSVDVVLNLHDGSGYYRPRHIDNWRNPGRWGQSVIIDQASLPGARHGDLLGMAEVVARRVNRGALSSQHRFHVKNTRTREGNAEMAKTLTYFAIHQGKAAFGLEASKSLPTHLRAYYHLLALEAYMRQLGIAFERTFPLTAEGVRRAINDQVRVSLYRDKILLELADARERLGYFPLKRDAEPEFAASNPLIAIVRDGEAYRVTYGNRRMTRLDPQFFEYDESLPALELDVDAERRLVPFGEIVEVAERFRVQGMLGYRVNIIGLAAGADDAGRWVYRRDIPARFSVDKAGTLFRVEAYRGDRFAGMVLVRFGATTLADVDEAGASGG